MSVAHLWMCVEALTKAALRRECLLRGCVERDPLDIFHIGEKDLDAYIRKTVILRGDSDCYQRAKRASDGFEHGFLDYRQIREGATPIRVQLAEYVRRFVFELVGLDPSNLATLTSAPYDRPMGYFPLVKYLKGTLLATSDVLAKEGNAYPFMRWNPSVEACQLDPDGTPAVRLKDQMTAEFAPGVSLRLSTSEVWRPG